MRGIQPQPYFLPLHSLASEFCAASIHNPQEWPCLVLEPAQLPTPLSIPTTSTIPICTHPRCTGSLLHGKVMDGSLLCYCEAIVPLSTFSLLSLDCPRWGLMNICICVFFKTWISHHFLCEAFPDFSRLILVLQPLSSQGTLFMSPAST